MIINNSIILINDIVNSYLATRLEKIKQKKCLFFVEPQGVEASAIETKALFDSQGKTNTQGIEITEK